MRRGLRHHAVILPHHQHPRHVFRGSCGLVSPLAPPGGWGIVVGDVHHLLVALRQGQVLAMPTPPRSPPLRPPPVPSLLVAALWPQPHRATAHPSLPCSPPPVAPSANAA
jgi:hypothetical protein